MYVANEIGFPKWAIGVIIPCVAGVLGLAGWWYARPSELDPKSLLRKTDCNYLVCALGRGRKERIP